MNKKTTTQPVWPIGSNRRVLPIESAKQVHRLFGLLDTFAYKEGKIEAKIIKEKKPVNPQFVHKEVRDYWYENPNLIDTFLKSTLGAQLPESEKEIVRGFKNHIRGKFLCIKHEKDYAVFRPFEEAVEGAYYAVLGLIDDLSVLIPSKTPCLIETAILPYKDIIICDGLIGQYSIAFGANMRNTFLDDYEKSNAIVSSLS